MIETPQTANTIIEDPGQKPKETRGRRPTLREIHESSSGDRSVDPNLTIN